MWPPKKPTSERGSGEGQHTPTLCEHTPHVSKPERVSKHTPGRWDTGPLHAWAFQDAAKQAIPRAGFRLIPCVSSETAGAPALLREASRKIAISKAVWRVSLS
jgi:hypothetical protein